VLSTRMLVQWEWRSAAYAGIHTCQRCGLWQFGSSLGRATTGVTMTAQEHTTLLAIQVFFAFLLRLENLLLTKTTSTLVY
jgi:hypothetical protein